MSVQLDAFLTQPRRHLTRGATYDAIRDGQRIDTALGRLATAMWSGEWMFLSDMATAARCSESAASARWRELRDPHKVGLPGEAECLPSGRWRYRLTVGR